MFGILTTNGIAQVLPGTCKSSIRKDPSTSDGGIKKIDTGWWVEIVHIDRLIYTPFLSRLDNWWLQHAGCLIDSKFLKEWLSMIPTLSSNIVNRL